MKQRDYSKNIASAIDTFLTEDDWKYTFDENRGLFKFGLSLKGKLQQLNYILEIREDDFVVYAISPLGADEADQKMMATMAEFVCRANYGLLNGNFELDMRDGEVRYKSFVDCEDITPSSEMIRNSIYCPASMFKRYGEGLIDIIFGGSTAKAAADKCENSSRSERPASTSDASDASDDEDMADMIARLAQRFGESDDTASE